MERLYAINMTNGSPPTSVFDLVRNNGKLGRGIYLYKNSKAQGVGRSLLKNSPHKTVYIVEINLEQNNFEISQDSCQNKYSMCKVQGNLIWFVSDPSYCSFVGKPHKLQEKNVLTLYFGIAAAESSKVEELLQKEDFLGFGVYLCKYESAKQNAAKSLQSSVSGERAYVAMVKVKCHDHSRISSLNENQNLLPVVRFQQDKDNVIWFIKDSSLVKITRIYTCYWNVLEKKLKVLEDKLLEHLSKARYSKNHKLRHKLMPELLELRDWKVDEVEDLLLWGMLNRNDDGFLSNMNLNAISQFNYQSVEGIEFDISSGGVSLMLVGSQSPLTTLFNERDIKGVMTKGIVSSSFSLDPGSGHPNHPFQELSFFPPSLVGTDYLSTLLHADYILKMLIMGVEISGKFPFGLKDTKNGFLATIPEDLRHSFRSVSERSEKRILGAVRTWIEAEPIKYEAKVENGKLKFFLSENSLLVKFEQILRYDEDEKKFVCGDKIREKFNDETPHKLFVDDMNKHMSQLELHMPVFARLKQLYRLSATAAIFQHVYHNLELYLPKLSLQSANNFQMAMADTGYQVGQKCNEPITKCSVSSKSTTPSVSVNRKGMLRIGNACNTQSIERKDYCAFVPTVYAFHDTIVNGGIKLNVQLNYEYGVENKIHDKSLNSISSKVFEQSNIVSVVEPKQPNLRDLNKKIIKKAVEKAAPKSVKRCARYVMMAVHDGLDRDYTDRCTAAHECGSRLTAIGYEVVTDSELQEGDIEIYPKNNKREFGHIQIWTGSHWYSDFKQTRRLPHSDYKGSQTTLYRLKKILVKSK